MAKVCGAVAQLGERYNRTVEAKGSNPFSSTCTWLHRQHIYKTKSGAVAQLGEHHNGIVGVKGSSPFSSTWIKRWQL